MVEVGGQDAEHNFISASLELQPRELMGVEQPFHSLAYVHILGKPDARIGIHCPQCGEPYLIPVNSWGNLWVYGMDIFLTGWLTHADFRQKASVLNIGARTFQFDDIRVKTLSVPSLELNPLDSLFTRVKEWKKA